MKLDSVRALKTALLSSEASGIAAADPPEVFARTAGRLRPKARRSLAATRTMQPPRVGLGVAPGARRGDYRLGARIHARGAEAARLARRLESRTAGEVDLRFVPEVLPRAFPPAWFRQRHRPLEAGLSVGHFAVSAGTLGFVVQDAAAYYLLSNNHVLANVNAAQPGDPIFQPGRVDQTPDDGSLVAVLDRFEVLSFIRENVVDCAVGQLLGDQQFYAGWSEAIGGVVQGSRRLRQTDLGTTVFKAGRTTGVTEGVITQVEIDGLRVNMGEPGKPKPASFSDQFEVIGTNGPFSQPGDSGSLVIHEDGHAVGLLFAGGPDAQGIDLTFVNDVETVLERLRVSLVL